MTALIEKCNVSVMIFTLNEEVNLGHCLNSLKWCDDVIVIDSGSTDNTVAMANASGARSFQREFDGFGSQRNWAIEHTHPVHDWVLILDADERVPDALAQEINSFINNADINMAAARVRRRFHMWGEWLKYSSLYPTWVVRLIHKDKVRYVNRGHAETQKVDGETLALENDLIDENHKGIEHWYTRQRSYSLKDAEYEIDNQGAGINFRDLLSSDPLARKMALKQLSWRLPFRSITYFIYSYFLRLGFLDGFKGLRFCYMRSQYQQMVVKHKRVIRINRC